MSNDEKTVRERRQERLAQQKRKELPKKLMRNGLIAAIIILVLGAGAYGIGYLVTHRPDCPDPHWHSTFQVYVPLGGDPTQPVAVDFQDPYYQLGADPLMSEAVHMHQEDGKNKFHFEENGVCVSVKEAFHVIDVQLTDHSIKLDGRHVDKGQSGFWENNDTATLRGFVRDADGNWTEWSMRDLLGYQLKDHEAILIAFGTYTDEQILQMKATVAPVGTDVVMAPN